MTETLEAAACGLILDSPVTTGDVGQVSCLLCVSGSFSLQLGY